MLGRIVCQLVNEAAFAVGEGVGSAEDVDAGLELGLNYPRGAVAWGEAIGLEAVLATMDGLHERHEERYRAAPALRRAAAIEFIDLGRDRGHRVGPWCSLPATPCAKDCS